MSAQQRAEVLETAHAVVQGRVPLLAGVIDPTTDRVIEHAQQARTIGVDALVLTSPFYARTSQPEILQHFRCVRESVDLPIIAYDIPVSTHYKLERATVVQLAREGVIVGLKDSSGDEANFRGVLLELQDQPGISLFTGSELTVDASLLMGARLRARSCQRGPARPCAAVRGGPPG
nr:dihydrodipicolinate synthase family protein [Deinobacterium chartae]